MKLATIINYCTNDERFIDTCIQKALLVSDQVIIPVSDHLYNGIHEDIDSLNLLQAKYPQVDITIYEWNAEKPPRYWHNMSRIIGTSLLQDDIDWVLFLDSDEILESELFKQFISNKTFEDYDSYKLACYWYFREENYQATTFEFSPVLVRKNLINIDPYNMGLEREQLHELLNCRKNSNVFQDGKPLVHHYSWVRTKEQMLQKVKSWGHSGDTDWVSLIEEEFSRPFNGTDFLPHHHYQYNIL